MKKLTKNTALLFTLDLWNKLAKSGSFEKSSVKRVTDGKDSVRIEKFWFECPCCHFVTQEFGEYLGIGGDSYMPCSDPESCESGHEEDASSMLNACPLKQLWPNGCLAHPSPFADWYENHDEEWIAERKRLSREIVDGCKKALSDA